jgi:6-pyruvoyltetrahydropterin/6-carboxytetrahydropterin synthase
MQESKFTSTKVFDGFSTCFRQWPAASTNCRFLHGYGTSFKVWFEGELDHRNWVFDFGGMKRAKGSIDGMSPNDYFKWLLDHTVIVAQDDPYLSKFVELHELGIIQLRIVPDTGCERFAELLFNKINDFVKEETDGRVRVKKLEFREHEKNTAIVSLQGDI